MTNAKIILKDVYLSSAKQGWRHRGRWQACGIEYQPSMDDKGDDFLASENRIEDIRNHTRRCLSWAGIFHGRVE
jgi:hypothetical protein